MESSLELAKQPYEVKIFTYDIQVLTTILVKRDWTPFRFSF